VAVGGLLILAIIFDNLRQKLVHTMRQ